MKLNCKTGILFCLILSINLSAQQYINWYPWPAGSTSQTNWQSDANKIQSGTKTGCVFADVNLSLSGGAWDVGPKPAWTNSGETFSFDMDLNWTNTSQNAVNQITLKNAGGTITNYPVTFDVYDLNAAFCGSIPVGNRFIDIVNIVGYKSDLTTVVNPVYTNICTGNIVTGNSIRGDDNCGSNARGVTVSFLGANSVARIVITYSSGTGNPGADPSCGAPWPLNAGENPKDQFIIISPLTITDPGSAAPTAVSGINTICNGSNTTLTATGGNSSSIWYTGSCGGTQVGTGSSITVSPSSTITYYVANQGLCSNTACATRTVTVNPAPASPTISSTAPTCSSAGTSSISNYNASLTYNFSPSGPTVGAGGAISGMTIGTSYTVTANNGSCNSTNSSAFVNNATLNTPSTPTINSIAPTCGVNGSSTISNYNAALTYNFSPVGPSVGAGGAISGMTVGTSYTVTASNASCPSSGSSAFSNTAMLVIPASPTISSTAPTCSVAGTSTVSNYNASLSYNFSPAGPTVGAGGAISGMTIGTTYTLTSNNGACNSNVSAAFSNDNILSNPIVTISSASICEDGLITLTPLVGGTWISNNTSVANVTSSGVVSIIGNGVVDFTFTSTNSCSATTTSTTVFQLDNASFNYSSNTFCLSGTNPIATSTGTPGGTYTISSPGVINASTGEINLASSGLGVFTIHYNTASAGNFCPREESATINITSAPSADFSYSTNQVCENAIAPSLTFASGASAGIFSSNPSGLDINSSNGSITLSSSSPGSYMVYNTIIPSGGCAAAIDSSEINILSLDNPSFNFASGATYCLTGANTTATITGVSGGTFTITNPGVINNLTGEVNIGASGVGTYTIYYNTPLTNACPNIDSTTITISNAPGASFAYASSFCKINTSASPTIVGNNFAGTFSSNPTGIVFVNSATGEINIGASNPGTYTIYNNLAAAGGCAAVLDSFSITIYPLINIQQVANLCSGSSYTFPDGTTQTNITSPVSYTSNFTSVVGCDSIIQTTVNINPNYLLQETVYVCSGNSFTFPDGTTQTNITNSTIHTSNLITQLSCDSIIETTIIINQIPSVSTNTNASICAGQAIELAAIGSGNGTITWYSDANGTNIIGTGNLFDATALTTAPGIYTVYVNENSVCSSNLIPITITVGGVTASISASPVTGFAPLEVLFGNNSTSGPLINYTWFFGDNTSNSNQLQPTHIYNNIGNYTAVLVVSDGICYDTAMVLIEVEGKSSIIIPNIFTPNFDGINDVLFIKGENIKSLECNIFNRWGQKLYEWNGVNGYWDGKTSQGETCTDGTYFYILTAKGFDSIEYKKHGSFDLIR